MPSNKAANILVFLIGLACLAASIGLSSRLEIEQEQFRHDQDPDELSLQGGKLKGFVLGSEGLVADWYWMRSLQYIGGKLHNSKEKEINIDDLTPLDPKLLYPLLDTATTLDPNFMAVYSYGATVLPAINKDQAVLIAKKGIANNPSEWILYHQLGFIYWKLGDYGDAAGIYRKGSEIEGAPAWMSSMAARMNADGGSRETARAIYSQLVETSIDDQTRESARLRLAELDSIEERALLDKALSEYRDRNNRCAGSWDQLFSLLEGKQLLDGRALRINKNNEIVDPTDAPYLIERDSCRASIDFSKSKLPRK